MSEISLQRSDAAAILALLDELALVVAGGNDLQPKYSVRYERAAKLLATKLKQKS